MFEYMCMTLTLFTNMLNDADLDAPEFHCGIGSREYVIGI